MMNFRKFLAGAVVGSMGLISTSATAEVIAADGFSPASSDAGLAIETIAVERMDGTEGSKVAFELKEAIDGLRLDDEQWFEIVPTSAEYVDATFRGSADSSSSITELDDKKVTTCAEKDDDGDCIRNKVSYYSCSSYEVSLRYDIELIGSDGLVLYSVRDEDSSSTDYCADEESRPSVQRMTDRLAGALATRTRWALAPRYFRSDYRLLERRKGLEKADRKLFKQGLKLTKSDAAAACEVFEGLEANNPQQDSVLFNIGLCHESRRDFALAKTYYQRAENIEPGKWMTAESLERVANRIEAEAQFARRKDFLESRYAEAPASPETTDLTSAE